METRPLCPAAGVGAKRGPGHFPFPLPRKSHTLRAPARPGLLLLSQPRCPTPARCKRVVRALGALHATTNRPPPPTPISLGPQSMQLASSSPAPLKLGQLREGLQQLCFATQSLLPQAFSGLDFPSHNQAAASSLAWQRATGPSPVNWCRAVRLASPAPTSVLRLGPSAPRSGEFNRGSAPNSPTLLRRPPHSSHCHGR